MNITLTKPNRLTNKNSFLIFFLIFLSTAFSCKEDPVIPPPPQPKITLTVDEVSCTEGWLNLKLENITLPVDLELRKDSMVIKTFFSFNSDDTTLYIDSLFPNKTYKLQASSIRDQASSNELLLTTLDTTSSNFSMELIELNWPSHADDVWIFSENNIWVVGDIYDSSGTEYNIMQWNGQSWIGRGRFSSSGIRGIHAFDSTNIFFSAGFCIQYKNGIFIEYSLGHLGFTNGQSVEKIWGSSEYNVCGVGPKGTIVHYNGTEWRKIEFDQQWNIIDITGNPETGIAYAVAYNPSGNTVIIKIEANSARVILSGFDQIPIIQFLSVYEFNDNLYLAGSSKIWRFNEKTSQVTEIFNCLPERLDIQVSFIQSSNDMFFIGNNIDIGKLIHFNGYQFNTQETHLNYWSTKGIHSIPGLTICVGRLTNTGFILKIERD